MTDGYAPRAVTMLRLFGPPLRRASLVGAVAGVVVGAIVAPAAGLMAPRGTVATLLVIAGAALVTAGIGTALAMLLVPSRIAAAYAVFSWLGHREVERFREGSASPIPVGPEATRAWLAANPSAPATASLRVELLAGLGRFDEARAELAALPAPVTDEERLVRASLRTWCEVVETGDVDLAAFDAVALTLPAGSDLRLEADVVRALTETRLRAVRGEADPLGPLRAVRPRLGREAASIVLRETWLRLARQLAVIGGAIGVMVAAFRPGAWG